MNLFISIFFNLIVILEILKKYSILQFFSSMNNTLHFLSRKKKYPDD